MAPGRLAACVACLALTFAACSDLPTETREPEVAATPSLSVRSGTSDQARPTDRHVISGIPADLAARVQALGGSLASSYAEIEIAIAEGLTDEAATTLATEAGIDAVHRDYAVKLLPDPLTLGVESLAEAATAPVGDPADAFFFPFQWNLRITKADRAWARGRLGSSRVTVAILDSGIDPFHIDLAGVVDEGRSIALVPSQAPVGPPWGDDYFHGTHVAGIVATNGLGTSGVANGTTLIAIKACDWLGLCSFSAVIDGIMYAAHQGVDVINMSLGGRVPTDVPEARELIAAVRKAVNHATLKGTLVVSAAGNDAVELEHGDGERYIPCEAGLGLCVGATDPADGLASYSNYGWPAMNLTAPGGDLLDPALEPTEFVISPCSTLSLFLPLAAGFSCAPNEYLWVAGTSVAAPHVAGAAALLDARYHGHLGPWWLRSRLLRGADDLGRRGPDDTYGRGRLNVSRTVR